MARKPIIYTKQILIGKLKKICALGWVKNARHGNAGGVGNTLEDLLGIEENNLPIPNAAEWELKCQRMNTSSLITLFHMEPSPRAIRFVPRILLPLYGWKHQTISREISFRQTINGLSCSDRGFNELNPQPYWGFDDLFHKAGTKLLNCFYVKADVKTEKGKEYFWYKEIMILQKFSLDKFIRAIEGGFILVDFDARTGHNHGTKFRLRQDKMPELYEDVRMIE